MKDIVYDEKLLQEIQKGLLNWYDFKPGSNILYIGKEDVYFFMLQELHLNVVNAPIEQTIDSEWNKKHPQGFDYIIAVRILEMQPKPKDFLKAWKALLAPNGILLLGMNNRFGLKYFCGDRDPYTDRILTESKDTKELTPERKTASKEDATAERRYEGCFGKQAGRIFSFFQSFLIWTTQGCFTEKIICPMKICLIVYFPHIIILNQFFWKRSVSMTD